MRTILAFILCLLCLSARAQNVSTGIGGGNADTNSFSTSPSGQLVNRAPIHAGARVMFWDDFNGGEASGKQFPVSPSGHQLQIPPAGGPGWQLDGWKVDRGFLVSTAAVHSFIIGPYVTNATQATRPWNVVGATTRWSLGNGGTAGNQFMGVGFSGVDPNLNTHSVCLNVDGAELKLQRSFLGTTVGRWTSLATATSENNPYVGSPAVNQPITNSFHTLSLTVVSNTFICEYDGQVFICTDTNVTTTPLSFQFPMYLLYGSSNCVTRQDFDSVWAGFASSEVMALADGGQNLFTGGILGRRITRPTFANMVSNQTTYISLPVDSEVILPTPGTLNQLVTNMLPTYLVEFGRPFRVWGNGTSAGSNAWVRTPDGKALLFKGQVTGPPMTNITINYGFLELIQSPWGWNVVNDLSR